MIVVKFGGTSVGTTEALGRAIDIVHGLRERSPVVVVSALSGITNQLDEASRAAAGGEWQKAQELIEQVRKRHESVAYELVMQKSDFLEAFNSQLNRHIEEILAVLRGMSLVGEITPRANDKIVSIGERLSSVLFAYTMRIRRLRGIPVDSGKVIITNECFGCADPIMEKTVAAAKETLVPEVERGHIPVMGGYFGSTEAGVVTTMGRGGSDYSAAIVGAAIDAEEIQIWTDVDGMMTSDPRTVPRARLIEELTFDEAAELAHFGAKVLHPKTVAPAVARGIPIRIKNTHNPESPGTFITQSGSGREGLPKAVAIRRGAQIITVTNPRMLGSSGFLGELFGVFERLDVPVDIVTTSEVSVSVTVPISDRIDGLSTELEKLGRVRSEAGYSAIAIVGEQILSDPPTVSRIFSSLEKISIVMMSLSHSGLSLVVVVRDSDADQALERIHRAAFEESEP